MSIQPIDLQTVYAQIDKVARVAAQDQNLQLANNMSIGKTQRANLEKTKQVQQTAAQEIDTETIKTDSKQSGSLNQNQTKKKETEEKEKEEEESKKQSEIKDPLLGQHIDITR